MGHIEASKDLAASPEAIWAVVANPQTWGDWFTIHEKWMEEPPVTLTVGAKLVDKIVMLGMANKLEWTVAEINAPTALVVTGTGMAGVKITSTFAIEPKGEGTNFTVSVDFDGALIKGALGKAVEKDGLRELEKSVEALNALAVQTA
ncbi:SRPBCC family protein [Smaragdicoccus niigatensis]|uniref:type II toxin-antitoxin system Rv0910 family toxin n=1 Tax=Smaragdicoccus niigatensis TaxID=359359 RepID=UPI000371D3E4|nr:SRPBCC family protein [Smaragdicoccus niigatensis]